MAAEAVRDERCAATHVLQVRDRLKMRVVDAEFAPTATLVDVVDLHAIWDRAVDERPGEPVGPNEFSTDGEDRVSSTTDALGSPEDAAVLVRL